MNEADEVFKSRISTEYVQREQMKIFSKLCKEGKAMSGLSEEEFNTIIQDLDNDKVSYSNDMLIDMIINFVIDNTKEEELILILQNLKIAYIEEGSIVASAYPKYVDDSYYVEIGKDIEKRVRLLSDVLAVLFMLNEQLVGIEYMVLYHLLEATKNRYNVNNEYTDEFNNVQKYMIICDNIYNDGFTDKYVAYAREIQEMAMAFLVGHEIGHHYYGHTTGKTKQGIERKMEELQADSFALNFAFKYLHSAYANDENIYGIHFFVGVYLPLIVSANISENISEDGENYPSIKKRMLEVQSGLEKELTIDRWEKTEKYRIFLQILIDVPLLISE